MSLIFLFVDGLGLAPSGPSNPLSTLPTPALRGLLGGALTTERIGATSRVLLRPIDATLGVEGLPQSGTGHVALLVGMNAAAAFGRHYPGFPPTMLRPLLAEQSIYHHLHALGRRTAFANAFTASYWAHLATRRGRRSASVIAAEGAGVRFRTLADLRAGQALMWDITNHALVGHPEDPAIPVISPEVAGANLARLATDHDFVFYECSLLDLAAHGRTSFSLEEGIARVDGLIGGVLANLGSHTLLITSDHGNIEDTTAHGHTRNPVPLLVVGPDPQFFADLNAIDQVPQAICNYVRIDTNLNHP